jgi:hypothetical protein
MLRKAGQATCLSRLSVYSCPFYGVTPALCRTLIAAGHEDGPMIVRDPAGRPLMTVPSIVAAAALSVIENERSGPRFGKWSPFVRDSIDARVSASAPGSPETV